MKMVYRFGLHAPHEGAQIVRDQVRLSRRHYNELVEIERGRRAAVRAIEAEAGDLPAAMQAMALAAATEETAYRAIAAHRARSRKRDESPELKAALTEARAARKSASGAVRQTREAIRLSPAVHAAKDAVGEIARGLANNAYEHSGLYWGQRALVNEASAASFAKTPMYDQDWQPNEPRFERFVPNDGTVGLQIMGGISVDVLHGCTDSRLRLLPPDARAWSGARSERRAFGSTADLWLRVGSSDGKPVWAKWICDMHRPLPKDAKIVWATVHQRALGPHSEWSLCLTIETSGVAVRPPTVGGSVAVDVGWRVMGDLLRVAGWQDASGARGELSLDAATLAALHAPEQLRSERDERFELAREAFARWVTVQDVQRLIDGPGIETRSVRQWRSPARLAALCRRWESRHVPGVSASIDAVIRDLVSWERRDRHLWACETRQRVRALRRRREIYRVFAARLADMYDTIIVEKFDKRDVAIRPVTGEEDDTTQNETARGNRVLAATSELVVAIVNAGKLRGREVIAAPCADSTRACPSCGLVEDRKAAESVRLRCECGAEWDQDIDGAPAVLLARERSSDAKILVSARVEGKASDAAQVSESRWARVRRLRTEKEVRMRTAREEADKVAE